MTEEDRKLLAAYLGEPYDDWHRYYTNRITGKQMCSCGAILEDKDLFSHLHKYNKPNRNFDTPQDFRDLVKRMVETGDWTDFRNTTIWDWWWDNEEQSIHNENADSDFESWLILNHDNCQFVCDFLKEKNYE